MQTTLEGAATTEKILLVDDDRTLTYVLSRALTRRGFKVSEVDNADAALIICAEQRFDKAIVDLKLAESSGLHLIPQLLEIQPQLAVVMLTGFSSIATAVEAIKLGAINYLCKPADVDEILSAFAGKSADINSAEELSPPSVDRLEWEHIQKVLQENEGNISATARLLGMHRRTLQRKLGKRPVKR